MATNPAIPMNWGYIIPYNTWNLQAATNGMANGATIWTSSNGVGVFVTRSNNVGFINYANPAFTIAPAH